MVGGENGRSARFERSAEQGNDMWTETSMMLEGSIGSGAT